MLAFCLHVDTIGQTLYSVTAAAIYDYHEQGQNDGQNHKTGLMQINRMSSIYAHFPSQIAELVWGSNGRMSLERGETYP